LESWLSQARLASQSDKYLLRMLLRVLQSHHVFRPKLL